MKHFSFTILIICIFSGLLAQNSPGINLNKGWEFRKVFDTNWYPASVPGTVHTDLMNNKIILDPYIGINETHVRWVENEDWEYRTTFSVPENIYSQKHIELKFEGLDTYARVYLNDSLIITADNMFRTWKADVKRLLKKDRNLLYIYFESAVKKGMAISSKMPYKLPGDEKVYTRKAQYQYGWDWGPRLVTCGIWKNIILSGWDNYTLEGVHFVQDSLTEKTAYLTAKILINSTEKANAQIVISDKASKKILKQYDIEVIQGQNMISKQFQIEKPQLWWCNGLGDAHMYQLQISMNVNNTILSKEINIGLRKLEIVREKDNVGSSFYVKLNDVPVFMKGANYIPPDNFMPRVDSAKYEKLIDNAVKSNMNMLRVWGGGNYENDYFYDLCDKNGILIWQDFMFACAMYPGTQDFFQNVLQEAIEQVCRLRNHPSIALWCGNNESDEGWKNWGWQKQYAYSATDSSKIWNSYLKLFQGILPGIISKFDRKRFYLPSSPLTGWGHKESLLRGDSHYWGVWWGMEPFSIYQLKIGRFMSEYGFQALPNINTIRSYSKTQDLDLSSGVMKAHQKHQKGYEIIQKYMDREYRHPVDFESYVYVSQLLQAYGIKTAIEAHRCARPYCMGTLYWQLNDCWPVVSWSGMDNQFRWKAMQYFVRDLYKDILVSVEEKNDSIMVHVVNDRNESVKGGMKMKLLDFSGKVLWEKPVLFPLKPLSSGIYYRISKKELIQGFDTAKVFLYTIYKTFEEKEYKNLYYFALPSSLKLSKPNITKNIKTYNGLDFICLTTDVLAKNVYLSVENGEDEFENNYFDLVPGKEVFVRITTALKKEEIINKLKVISLVDTY